MDSYAAFAALNSSTHDFWAREYASAIGEGHRYIAGRCFETFPFPPDFEINPTLESAGQTYYDFRASLMIEHDEGLTKTYNRFHDPEERNEKILQLRELHAAMDRAVLDAYGWTDIPTDCEFILDYEEDEDDTLTATGKKRKKKKPWRCRWPDPVRDDVLARLLELNAQRAAEEAQAAAAAKPPKKARGRKKKPAAPTKPAEPFKLTSGQPPTQGKLGDD